MTKGHRFTKHDPKGMWMGIICVRRGQWAAYNCTEKMPEVVNGDQSIPAKHLGHFWQLVLGSNRVYKQFET